MFSHHGLPRLAVPDLRHASPFAKAWPACSPNDAPAARRQRQRAWKLTPAQETTIRALAGKMSLRSLAAEFAVSHETVRRVLREAEAAVA